MEYIVADIPGRCPTSKVLNGVFKSPKRGDSYILIDREDLTVSWLCCFGDDGRWYVNNMMSPASEKNIGRMVMWGHRNGTWENWNTSGLMRDKDLILAHGNSVLYAEYMRYGGSRLVIDFEADYRLLNVYITATGPVLYQTGQLYLGAGYFPNTSDYRIVSEASGIVGSGWTTISGNTESIALTVSPDAPLARYVEIMILAQGLGTYQSIDRSVGPRITSISYDLEDVDGNTLLNIPFKFIRSTIHYV